LLKFQEDIEQVTPALHQLLSDSKSSLRRAKKS